MIWVLSLCFAASAYAALYTNPNQLRLDKSYDYIIVGGGAAGGVLVNRLSERADLDILLIEAGSSDFRNINIQVPFFSGRLQNSQFDWNFTTVSQLGLSNRSIPYPRGHVLGGSTSINSMVFTRGSKDDFDRWANVTEDDGWSWNSLQPYIRKLEKLVPPTDGRDTTGEFDPSVHGYNGPVRISLPGVLQPTDERVIGTTRQLSDEFPFNLDYNSGNTIGIGWVQFTIADGERVNSATAYIAPALSRGNVDVLVNTLVTRVLQSDTQAGIPVFRTVEFTDSPSSPRYTFTATKEVILSAGAVKTPHILLLSGIGDSRHLASHGIKEIVDLPDVGNNLQDHPAVPSSFTVNSTDTRDNLRDEAFSSAQLALWQRNRTGLLAGGATNQLGWIRLPSNASIFGSTSDPSAGPTSAHYEIIFTNGFLSFFEPFPGNNQHFFTIVTVVVSPTARGNISLASTDPFDAPIIDPNLLGTDFDIFTIREAIKAARRFASAPAWDGWILEEHGPFSLAQTDDDEIEQYARNWTDTLDHVSSTAAMGKTGSTGIGSGALNSDLTVKGTIGLRVVDASAFPFVPAAHTQAAAYILAERAADIIKASLKSGYDGVYTSSPLTWDSSLEHGEL